MLRNNNDENGFFNKRQKTIIIKNSAELKKGLLLEKKIITPKSKQSCSIKSPYSPYKICQTKVNLKSSSRKISTNNVEEVNKTKIKAKSKSICPITQKKTGNKDPLVKKGVEILMIKLFIKKSRHITAHIIGQDNIGLITGHDHKDTECGRKIEESGFSEDVIQDCIKGAENNRNYKGTEPAVLMNLARAQHSYQNI